MKKSQMRRIALAGSIAIALGCSSDNKSLPTNAEAGKDSSLSPATFPPGAPARITLTPSATAELAPAGALQLSAAVTDATGKPALSLVLWSSSNSAIAAVADGGSVTATTAGTAVITATVRSNHAVMDSIVVTVRMPVKTIGVALNSPSIAIGGTSQATATLKDSLGQVLTGRIVKWSSATPAVASVDSTTGKVIGVASGTSTITATSITATNVFVTGTATISVALVPLKTITVGLGSATIATAATTQATATLKDSLGQVLAGRTVTWRSTNATVAMVNASTGIVTGVAAGTSAITASSGSVSGSATVTVTSAAPPPPPNPGETLATLPQVYLNTTAPAAPAPGGKIISVANGGNLQTALNSALPGDVVELANGATFTGNFILPNKNTTSTSWIVIRPASSNGLPAAGVRMTRAIAAAANLPIIASPSNQGAFQTAQGAHHYRLIGLEVRSTVTNTGLVRLGEDGTTQRTVASIPHDLVLDRMYIHGSSTLVLRRCVVLNSASSAVIDSYLADCHDKGSDSQAILGWNGPGPFKIVNNYLEAAGEVVMFGGGDPGVQGLLPSDIEIRHNHITRPTSWKGVWMIKNLLELKSAQRVLIEGNILENNWTSGQTGTAINLKSANQDGTAPWQGTRDVTLRLNLIRNVGSGIVFEAINDTRPGVVSFHTARLTINDNVISTINQGIFDGAGIGFLFVGDPADLVIAHNTVVSPDNSALALASPSSLIRLRARDNVFGTNSYGIKGDGVAGGTASLNMYAPGAYVAGNVFVYYTSAGQPAGNFFPTTLAAVGFANAGAFDFHLTSSSPYRLKATDGRDPGANIDAVNAAVAGAIVP